MFLTKTDWKNQFLKLRNIHSSQLNLMIKSTSYWWFVQRTLSKTSACSWWFVKTNKKRTWIRWYWKWRSDSRRWRNWEISEGTKIIAAWDWQRKIILLNKRKNGYPFTMLAKGQRIIFIYFFCYRAKRHYTDRKVTLFCGFFGVCIYIPLACQFIKKDWQATGLCTQTPKKCI